MARPRSADFAINRETIVRAAARLFAQAGYPGTAMSDIARECGISKPLLYHYVSDKYQLLLEIADGHVSRLEALVAEVDAQRLAPEPRLRQLIARFVDEYAQARHDHGVLTQDVKFLSGADRARVLGKERHVVDAFARTIAAARPELRAAALDKPLTMLLFGMMNWMFTWLRPDGKLSHHDMAPVVADLFLGGLAAVQPIPRTTSPRQTLPAGGPGDNP
ncbi:TetR/AcrR family transcriptional regulator [Piscinibacter sp.]|jgi:AcrR family transcriptional regulator|uniref:TetR/AcrR family transcriptional regulator n=1 Tax=Piscinibacter sp. TaxID=1903157 RepID=UPI003559BF38